MNFFKILSIFMAFVMIASLGSGCVKEKAGVFETTKKSGIDYNNTEQIKAVMLEHLALKYGTEFECLSVETPSVFAECFSFTVVEKGADREAFSFRAFYYLDGEQKFEDGYFGVLLREKIAEKTLELIGGNNCKVFARPTSLTFDESLNANSTFEDVLAAENIVCANIYIFGTETNLKISDIADALAKKGISGVLFYYCIDETILNGISKVNYDALLSEILAGKIETKISDSCKID